MLSVQVFKMASNGVEFSDYYVENGTFLKMENITVAYSWKLNMASLSQSSKVHFSVQNLFTLTRYTDLDPEVRYFNSPHYYGINHSTLAYSPLTSGLERSSNIPPEPGLLQSV